MKRNTLLIMIAGIALVAIVAAVVLLRGGDDNSTEVVADTTDVVEVETTAVVADTLPAPVAQEEVVTTSQEQMQSVTTEMAELTVLVEELSADSTLTVEELQQIEDDLSTISYQLEQLLFYLDTYAQQYTQLAAYADQVIGYLEAMDANINTMIDLIESGEATGTELLQYLEAGFGVFWQQNARMSSAVDFAGFGGTWTLPESVVFDFDDQPNYENPLLQTYLDFITDSLEQLYGVEEGTIVVPTADELVAAFTSDLIASVDVSAAQAVANAYVAVVEGLSNAQDLFGQLNPNGTIPSVSMPDISVPQISAPTITARP